MTTMVGPHCAVEDDDVPGGSSAQDGALAALVRRWMASGSEVQDRMRRDSIVRAVPEPDEAGGDVEGAAEALEPAESLVDDAPRPPATALTFPPLPRRELGAEPRPTVRAALLVDARRMPAGVAAGLLAGLTERSSVGVCRTYADWNRSDLGEWVGGLRGGVLHSFHQFADDDDQALVAMAIDAIDLARDGAVDEVVLAGDLTSTLPLIHRLHASGVRVVGVGAAHTPHDVRAACDEFIDTDTISVASAPAGRHRA